VATGAEPPGFDALGRSRACAGGAHADCGHVRVGARQLVSSPSRLKSLIFLCGCDCHAECAFAGHRYVPLTVWQQVCDCPGGERHRAWAEDSDEPWPGAREVWDSQQRRSQENRDARRQAFRTAREAASGKTRDEVRDIFVAELLARGQEIPSEPLLAADLDFLTATRCADSAKSGRCSEIRSVIPDRTQGTRHGGG
jgi:hypothetical protein